MKEGNIVRYISGEKLNDVDLISAVAFRAVKDVQESGEIVTINTTLFQLFILNKL